MSNLFLLPNDDVEILIFYVDIRIMCPAKTYSQLSTNSQSSGKKSRREEINYGNEQSRKLLLLFFLRLRKKAKKKIVHGSVVG